MITHVLQTQDRHAGYNHSGKSGSINFLNGVMGLANAQRALDYIRIITEFISQPEWVDVVPVFSIMNEALISTIGTDQMTTLYVLICLHALVCPNSHLVV
jgi:glucan 1,3-beta-glucosidase